MFLLSNEGFSFSPRKIFQLTANGEAEKQNINLVPISQRQRYEYYINHSEGERGLRAEISPDIQLSR